MNSFERLGSLLTGKLPDRVPVFCNLLEQGAEEMGIKIKEYYSSGSYVAEGQLRLQEKYGYDNLWAFHYTALEAEILGSKHTVFSDEGPPNTGHLVIQSEDDIEKLVIDDALLETGPFRENLKTLEILKREKGGEIPIITSVVGSFSLPPILMGMDRWMQLLYTGSERIKHLLLEKCSDFCILKARALIDSGVDIVAYNNPLGSATFITMQQFEKTALKWVKRDYRGINSPALIYFNGGGIINPMIDSIIENTGAGSFYINPLDNIAEAKKNIAGRAILAAPVNDIKLINSSEDDIFSEVKRIISSGAEGGGFIFGTLVMPLSIPEKNIHTLIRAAEEYGRY